MIIKLLLTASLPVLENPPSFVHHNSWTHGDLQNYWKMNIKQSALCEHLLQCNCMVNFDFIILAAGSNKLKLLMWKSLRQDDKIVNYLMLLSWHFFILLHIAFWIWNFIFILWSDRTEYVLCGKFKERNVVLKMLLQKKVTAQLNFFHINDIGLFEAIYFEILLKFK